MGTFLSDIVLALLSYVADNERCNIRQRQHEGIVAARIRGVKFGRPVKSIPENFKEIVQMWCQKEISAKQAADMSQIPLSTFYEKARKIKENI